MLKNVKRLEAQPPKVVEDTTIKQREHPLLRPGEKLDLDQPPQDIAKHFHRALIPDHMLQQMIETLEEVETGGMIEGAGVHATLLDFKKLKFLCRGMANAYFHDDTHQLHEYMQVLGAILNVRFRGTPESKTEDTS